MGLGHNLKLNRALQHLDDLDVKLREWTTEPGRYSSTVERDPERPKKFSIIARTVLPTASAEPLIVWTAMFFPSTLSL